MLAHQFVQFVGLFDVIQVVRQAAGRLLILVVAAAVAVALPLVDDIALVVGQGGVVVRVLIVENLDCAVALSKSGAADEQLIR